MPGVPVQVKYYVYDPNAKNELGGHVIKEENGDKFVLMTSDQANYWLSMLAIGRDKFSTLPLERQKSLNQQWGGKLIPPETP